jgi:hypothetical protein
VAVLLVVGDQNNLGAGDLELEDILDDLNIDTDFANDEDDRRDAIDDVDDFDAVFISGSVAANVLNDEYSPVRLPILVMNNAVYPEMDLTDETENIDFGLQNESELELENDNHPLAAGLDQNDDELEVSNNAEEFNFGEVEGQGEEIATTATGNQTAIFVYERDDEGNDDRALTDRRVGFFATDAFIDDLASDGELLLEAAILYTSTGQIDQIPE